VEFLGRRFDGLLRTARESLAQYVNADPDDLVYVTNASEGINRVARSLPLQPGDEILTTNHEYGAMNFTWEYVCRKTGARYIQHPIPLPVKDPAEVVESLWRAVTPRTRVIFISHITSPTALILPVAEVCRRAREAGIWTVVDGAHVPGQIPLDLTALDADFYSGNCHKWLGAPKGAGFLYARRELQSMIEPSVISWGWQEQYGFVDRHQWQGTSDIAAYLTVPAAIAFQQEHDWEAVRTHCHTLASEARARVAELTGLEPIAPDSPDWFAQMVTVPLPACDAATVKQRLYDEFRVEVPVVTWEECPFVRVSFQGYNTVSDLEHLINALGEILS
jgi:isopenicillin-N epimerase